jgi:hypothetical protein
MRITGRRATLVAAIALVACAGCGADEDPAADQAVTYVDDRGPGARTAAAKPLPNGTYDDAITDGNIADQAEEVVRDYQESLATGSSAGACREMTEDLQQRIGRGGSCAEAVDEAIAAQDDRGSGFRPSKILAVRVPGVRRARVTVQDGDREPFVVILGINAGGYWGLTSVDLGDPSGLRPIASASR